MVSYEYSDIFRSIGSVLGEPPPSQFQSFDLLIFSTFSKQKYFSLIGFSRGSYCIWSYFEKFLKGIRTNLKGIFSGFRRCFENFLARSIRDFDKVSVRFSQTVDRIWKGFHAISMTYWQDSVEILSWLARAFWWDSEKVFPRFWGDVNRNFLGYFEATLNRFAQDIQQILMGFSLDNFEISSGFLWELF